MWCPGAGRAVLIRQNKRNRRESMQGKLNKIVLTRDTNKRLKEFFTDKNELMTVISISVPIIIIDYILFIFIITFFL